MPEFRKERFGTLVPIVKEKDDLSHVIRRGNDEFIIDTMFWEGASADYRARVEKIAENEMRFKFDDIEVPMGFRVTRGYSIRDLEHMISDKVLNLKRSGYDGPIYFTITRFELWDQLRPSFLVTPSYWPRSKRRFG